MNKFNKIFRKSMAIPQGGGGSGNESYSSYSSASSSPPSSSSSYMANYNSSSSSNNTGGGSAAVLTSSTSASSLNISSAKPPTNPHHQPLSNSSGGIGIGGSMINLHSNSSNSIGSNGGGGSSQTNLYSQYQTLACIDFEQIFLPYINDNNDKIKSYFLVHSILSKKVHPSSSSSDLNNNTKDERSNSEIDASTKSSWQPFYKKNSNASFLILCNKSIYILDATTQPFTITKKILISEIKEIIFETSELGLFSIELNNTSTTTTPNILFFTVGCEKKEIHEQLNQSFDEILKEYYKNKDIFILKKCNMLGSVDQTNKKEFKNYVNQTLDEMSMYGFSAQDLWEGNADLKFWVEKIKDRIVLNNDERFVVEFILPENLFGVGSATTGSSKRIYRVPNDICIKDITNFLCIKASTSTSSTNTVTINDSSIYTLATIKGKELDGDDILADYGLGSFFDNWQLVLVERGKTRRAGLFNLEVHFPDNPEYRGRYHRVLELDGYMTASKLVKHIGEQMDISKSHLYCIKMDVITTSSSSSSSSTSSSSPSSSNNNITNSNSTSFNTVILDDDDYLTTHGLGSKFLKCKLKLVPKKFPKASRDKQVNYDITLSIIDDIIENSWKVFNERKEERVKIICNEIVESIVDIAYIECKRASTLSLRIASMGAVGRNAMYKLLAQKEQEELAFYKIQGQKIVANEAKDLINSLTPLQCPTGSNIQLDDNGNQSSLVHRVAPPPPPPILGFKDFKPKKKSLLDGTATDSSSSSSSSSSSHIKSMNNQVGVDMSQILTMRGKLRSMKKTDQDEGGPSSSSTSNNDDEKNRINFTLRNTKSLTKNNNTTNNTPPQVANETNELMLKLQKRHAAVALDAEDLGDS